MYIFLLILVSSKVLLSVTEIDNFCESHYKLAWTESRKSYCTTPVSALASAMAAASALPKC